MKTKTVFLKPRIDNCDYVPEKIYNSAFFTGFQITPILPEVSIIEYSGDCGVTKDGTVYHDKIADREFGIKYYYDRPDYTTYKDKKYLNIGGTCLNLGSGGTNNYGHWLLDSMSRLSVIKEYMPNVLDECDYIYSDFPNFNDVNQMLKTAGLKEKIIKVEASYQCLTFEKIYRPSLFGAPTQHDRKALDCLKNLFSKPITAKGDKIFILRNSAIRKIKNQNEVLSLVTSLGYKVVDIRKEKNPIQVFQNAKIIVSPHQALLVNTIFCNQGTRLLELMPSAHCSKWYLSCCKFSNMKYEVLVCESEKNKNDYFYVCSESDIVVDIVLLEKILKSYE